MNTDKIYAERLASEYAPKTTRKIKALIRLGEKKVQWTVLREAREKRIRSVAP